MVAAAVSEPSICILMNIGKGTGYVASISGGIVIFGHKPNIIIESKVFIGMSNYGEK